MQILALNNSDINGGAARAAYRIHRCLRDVGVDSRMWVDRASAGDWTVEVPTRKCEKISKLLRSQLSRQFSRLLKTSNPIIHSPALFPSRRIEKINSSSAVIVHLHWVADEMLSIADIGRIQKPLVWTLHDMWAFCGAEHYTDDSRWRDGYSRRNRPEHESGFDLNRWTWLRKCKHWHSPFQIVTPSCWLANCVRESDLMGDWPVTVIPNALDTTQWKQLPQTLARELLALPSDVPLVLFGAMGGGGDPRKGFDLLLQSVELLRDVPLLRGMELIVFGQLAPKTPPALGFPMHYVGHLHDDFSLRALYSAADLLVVPSRQDNLPNTGVEAQACGTPVVAFDTCGLPDIVQHQQTGYLAHPFDAEDLAAGIVWVLKNAESHKLRENSRDRAVKNFSCHVVAEQYLNVYRDVISRHGRY